MIATKIGKCAVCRTKVTERREFLPQTRLFEPIPDGITREMRVQIIAWRDKPILCGECVLTHEVRKVAG